MGKNNDWKERLNIVYSTNPDFQYETEQPVTENTLPPQQQKLRIQTDRKKRAGKTVTLVNGFVGEEEDLRELGKWLKSRCGTGGSTKDGVIIIQGDFKQKIVDVLKEEGYTQTKPVG